jgi:hypothetical protein
VLSETAIPSADRRRIDRRQRPTPILSRYTLIGRRRGFRRAQEGQNAYVDRYSHRLVLVAVTIIGLCILDALFTLLYIQRGGTELNPVMDWAIRAGVTPFMAIKCGLTTLGVLFLCLHKNFRLVKLLIGGVLGIYLALLGYHIYLTLLV